MGPGRNVYNVVVSSTDGSKPYEGFASAIGVVLHDIVTVKGKEPVKSGPYQVRGVPVTAEFDPSANTLTLNGVPPQALTQLCCQPRYVGELTLGSYHDATGRFKMRRQAKQRGIKVMD